MLATPEEIDGWLPPLLHAHAPLRPVPLCPTLQAFQANDELALWQAVERAAGKPVEAPFYAVAWPGAQALARALLDGLVDVRGRRVLDLGCGGGLCAVTAAALGAARAVAVDIDALALGTCRALARAQCVSVETHQAGLPVTVEGNDAAVALLESGLFDGIDVVLVADLVYGRALAGALRVALEVLAAHYAATEVLVADSGRPYFASGVAAHVALRTVAAHDVPVARGVEGCTQRHVSVYAPAG